MKVINFGSKEVDPEIKKDRASMCDVSHWAWLPYSDVVWKSEKTVIELLESSNLGYTEIEGWLYLINREEDTLIQYKNDTVLDRIFKISLKFP